MVRNFKSFHSLLSEYRIRFRFRDLLRDEAEFGPEPDKFMPERFLNKGVRDPLGAGAFGYGRRFASNSVQPAHLLIQFYS